MRRKIIIFLAIFFTLTVFKPGYCYWLWTPKTGKFVNPKKEPKSTPKDQFEYAKSFLDEKDYELAKREFKKLLKNYPKSVEAADAQFYLGQAEEDQNNLFQAYLEYQKVIDKYPFSERIASIIEKEYKIAEAFMGGYKRRALGVDLPVENPAIEIFSKVVENSTYGPLAAKAQYKLGLVLKSLSRYYEAEDAFNKVVSSYPDSEWVSPAKFQIAACRANLSKSSDYDQVATKEAKEKFEDFLKEHPDAQLSEEAEKNIDQLKEKEAQSNFDVARFYEKQKDYKSAKIYYQSVIDNVPNSAWAQKAMERVQIIEKSEK